MKAAWLTLCVLMLAVCAGCADDAAEVDTAAPADSTPTPEQIEAERDLAEPD
jgi:hypothetical protein